MTVLTFPTLVQGPSTVLFYLQSNTRTFTSPINGNAQTEELLGSRWIGSLTWNTLGQADWRKLQAFLTNLAGQAGRFYYTPSYAATPQLGVPGGSPVVNGANQTGKSLITSGWPNSTLVLKAGDFFSFPNGIGVELHQVTADATSDGSGHCTLAIAPQIRISPANAAALTVSNPTCIMRLKDDDQGQLSVAPPVIGSLSLDFMESVYG